VRIRDIFPEAQKIRMVDEGHARRRKLLQNLWKVVIENVQFGVDEGIKREYQVKAFRRSTVERQPLVLKEYRMGCGSKNLLAGANTRQRQIYPEVVLAKGKYEFCPAPEPWGNF